MLGGRAIGATFTITQVMRWADETGGDPSPVDAAAGFLAADIDGIRREFQLLASGVIDDPGGQSTPPAIVRSRSIPASI